MALLFLLGSGTSVDAGMPRVDEISASVRSGEGVFLGSDALYHVDPKNPNFGRLRAGAEPAIEFVQSLERLAAAYYQALDPTVRGVDYEELAFLAGGIQRAVGLSQENPALLPLIRELAGSGVDGNLRTVGDRAKHAWNYVRDVTRTMLDRPPTTTAHLAVVTEACRSMASVDLFTLNHDLVLEAALGRAGIPFSDGFERTYGDIRIWNDIFSGNVRLLKLHGSISWWGYTLPHEEWRGYVTARVTNDDPFHARGIDGRLLPSPHDLRPIFLAGTFDKLFGYESWIFPDQHYRFHEALRASTRLVVIGYGFRDQAINSRLIDWLTRSEENRMIVVHGDADQIPIFARTAIQNHWDAWVRRGRVRLVRSWVADTPWGAVDAAL